MLVCFKYFCRVSTSTSDDAVKHPAPSRPWERVGADLCELSGKHYLILVDYYSNFIEVDQLRETTSGQIIERCKSHFARHGIPDIFVTDNGPQFSSGKFSKFSSDYQFQHHTSSPHYPRSNSKAEKAVQTVKNLLRKAQVENRDFHLALLDLRNSPTNDDIGSPVQRLMGRRTKTLLPTADNLLRPKIVSPATVKSHRLEQQERQKQAYDKTARPLTTLQRGDHVRFKNGTLWQPAVVTEVSAHPRPYIIQTPEGQVYRRNRAHLRPDSSSRVDSDDDDDLHEDGEGEGSTQSQTSETAESGTADMGNGPTELRRSKRTTPRPISYANPYSRSYPHRF